MSRVEIKGKDTNDPSAPEVVLAVTATEVGTHNAIDVNVVQTVGGASSTTEYTEDAASAANPTGGQLMARRRDSLSSETTTDGDVTALNSTAKGELYVKHVDSIPVTDNGGSLTVDGTVELGATSLAALENISVTVTSSAEVEVKNDSGNPIPVSATDLDIRDLSSATDSVAAVQSGTWNINNISGTISLPTGAATAANQTTIIGHVDGIEGLLTTIDADTSALAGTVSGSELQVDVITMPTVTVTATNLDIRDLVSASDSVTVVPQTTTAGAPASVTVSTSAVSLAASNANRRSIIITNNSTGNLFIGHSNAVTSSGAAMGLIIPPYGAYSDSGHGIYTGDLYGIYSAAAASHNVSVSERT